MSRPVTLVGTDAQGLPVSETILLPEPTPASVRVYRMLGKILRGAYHTTRRRSRALRRYTRAVTDAGAGVSTGFVTVSEIVVCSGRADDSLVGIGFGP